MGFWIFLAVLALLGLWLVMVYNGLVGLRQRVSSPSPTSTSSSSSGTTSFPISWRP